MIYHRDAWCLIDKRVLNFVGRLGTYLTLLDKEAEQQSHAYICWVKIKFSSCRQVDNGALI